MLRLFRAAQCHPLSATVNETVRAYSVNDFGQFPYDYVAGFLDTIEDQIKTDDAKGNQLYPFVSQCWRNLDVEPTKHREEMRDARSGDVA
jgi:hypothetical protein